jgi:hypothetical protein
VDGERLQAAASKHSGRSQVADGEQTFGLRGITRGVARIHKRGRQVQLRASAKGWAQIYLKENPYTYRKCWYRYSGGIRHNQGERWRPLLAINCESEYAAIIVVKFLPSK